MNPRILNLTGTTHPKVEIQSVDAGNGVATFRWLDADGNPVDSGGSVARFTPAVPNELENPGDPITYPEVSDATLIDAIENPPAAVVPVPDVISRAEFVIALRRVLGLVEGDVFALISQLPSGEQQETARDLWENAREFRRDNSFLAGLAQLNGNTSEEIDEVFRVGSALNLD